MIINKLSTKLFFPLTFLAVSFGYFWSIYDFTLTGIDDANIFFVYAKNFSSGAGFVYNIGGEHVEGFSSILWTLLGSVVFSIAELTAVKPELILLVLNLLLVIVVSVVTQNLISQFSESAQRMRFWQAGFLFLLLTAPNFIFWSTLSLMEVALWCLLLTLTTALILRTELNGLTSGLLSLLFVLMILTRPESYLWVFVFSAIFFLRVFQANGLRKALSLIIAPLIVIGTTIGLVTVFRLNYFGYPFPNTYYAKVSPSIGWNLFEGSRYLIGFTLSNPIATLAVIAVFANLIKLLTALIRAEQPISRMLFLSAIGFVGLSIPLLTGGDHFAGYRFFQPIYPILLVNLTFWLFTTYQSFDKWAEALLVLALSLILGLPLISRGNESLGFQIYQINYPFLICVLVYLTVRILPRFSWFQRLRGKMAEKANLQQSQLAVWLTVLTVLAWQQIEFVREYKNLSYDLFLAGNGQLTGEYLTALFSNNESLPAVGVIPAGGIKYGYPGEVVDLLGLNHVQMGHSAGDRKGLKNHAAFDKAVFYNLSPDLMTPIRIDQNSDYLSDPPYFERLIDRDLLKNIYDDSEFQATYSFAVIYAANDDGADALAAWYRDDYLSELENDLAFQVERIEYQPLE